MNNLYLYIILYAIHTRVHDTCIHTHSHINTHAHMWAHPKFIQGQGHHDLDCTEFLLEVLFIPQCLFYMNPVYKSHFRLYFFFAQHLLTTSKDLGMSLIS